MLACISSLAHQVISGHAMQRSSRSELPRAPHAGALAFALLAASVVAGCSARDTLPVGGSVRGLVGRGLLLRNNGSDDLLVIRPGAFEFPTRLAPGAAYQVSVAAQPTNPSQTCEVSNGSGTITGAALPTIAVLCRWDSIQVAAGSVHTAVVRPDGTLWAWGDNGYGQLGDGTTAQRSAPMQVGTDTRWASAEGGYWHTVAVKTDGTLWAWGKNDFGQLGVGDWHRRATPTQVGTDSHWSWAAAGDQHTVATKTDGTRWACRDD